MKQGSSEYLKLLGFKRYHYRWWPQGSAARLVLVHGRGESADIWAPFATELAAETEIVAVDLRGHGGTPWDPDEQYEFSGLVDDLGLQLGHWRRRSVVVGHGLGGHLAIAVAPGHVDEIAALVLIETDPDGEPQQALLQTMLQSQRPDGSFAGRFASPGWRAVYEQLTWATPGAGRRPKCDPAVLARRDAPRQWDLLSSVRVPVLVVRGRAGWHLHPETAVRMTESFPAGSLSEVDGGAWPHVDSPASIAAAVRSFLRQRVPPAET